MIKFRETVERCELWDLGWTNLKFIWSNRHCDDTFTMGRLDRDRGWVE